MVCLAHAQPADVHLLHPEEGLSRRRPRLLAQPPQAGPEQAGKDKFHTFYRYFLLRLFHEGLGQTQERSAELEELLGKVPYLNGGLFEVHELEQTASPSIDIPDKAFERLFEFFDDATGISTSARSAADNEINPDVLGYIFEKYINQKQMGAYYTKEDITEYISKNTIIPFLFDEAGKQVLRRLPPDRRLATAAG